MRRSVWQLSITVVLIVGAFVATLVAGNSPVLGLDLQGGIEVRLEAVGRQRGDAVLDKAVDIIRSRVDGLGVAETEVKRDGEQIVVNLPGVKDRNKARRLVGKTAELRFRPVLAVFPQPGPETSSTSRSGSTSSTTGATSSSSASSSTSATSSTTVGEGGGPGRSAGRRGGGPSTTSTTRSGSTSTTSAAATSSTTAAAATSSTTVAAPQIPGVTPPAEDRRSATVVLDGLDGLRYQLGPTKLTGRRVTSARAQFGGTSGGGWAVNLQFDSRGSALFNELAQESYSKTPPQNAVAIVLDGVVQSAPTFQTPSFEGGQVQITGDFSQSEAEDLATVLKFGSLPVQLKELTTTSISPTLGRDQLDAGILAGVIGLLLVSLYMLAYYRLLGAVVLAGLVLAGMAVYTIITYLGDSIGLTLTLAGVVGLIVSVGITVDSYVVYFEKLKDEVRSGRTVRSSVDRAFKRSFRTIVAADLVSLIAAAILYWRAVGSVRQFAFLLGLSTLLDLFISYYFMHPLVQIMARSRRLVTAKKVGIAAGLDSPEAVA